MNFSFLENAWNELIYGWKLNQIGETLFVAPDVSHWSIDVVNQKIDENKFKKQIDEKGVKAIIYKGTDANKTTGNPFVDVTAKFWWNIGGKFNLLRGCYHWLQYSIDPTVAFEYYFNFIKEYPTELPAIMDFEEPSVTNGSDYLWRAKTWLGLAEQMMSKKPVIYTAPWFINKIKELVPQKDWESKIGWLRNYPLWVASYSRYWPKSLYPWGDFVGWQYSDAADFPYYKDDDTYDGLDWGIQSKGLDMNLFKIEWLNKYSENIIEEPPNNNEDEGDEDMSVWSDKARLLYVDGEQLTTVDELSQYDGLIAKIGSKFTANVQVAYDASKPIILFVENKIFKNPHVDFGINENVWLDENHEILIIDPEIGLDRYIYTNGIKRKIHGIMLDCSGTYTSDTKEPLTSTWIVKRAKWMLNMIYKRYKLPVYMYMNSDPVNMFTGVKREEIYSLIIEFGVSTVSKALLLENGYPSDSDRPKLPYDDTSKVRWYFWLYNFTNGWKFLYNGTKEYLYDELGYESVMPDDDPTIPPDEETPEIIPVDLSELNKKIDDIKSELDIALDLLGEIRQHFS